MVSCHYEYKQKQRYCEINWGEFDNQSMWDFGNMGGKNDILERVGTIKKRGEIK